jgi:cytochrome oxidase Cu insertion factor (SCO1/SenC/PrrC family)
MSALLGWRARGCLGALALLAVGAAPPPVDRAAAELGVRTSPAAAAPEVVLGDIDGTQALLSPRQGEVLVVTFFATWCDVCRRELPALLTLGRELAARHPGRLRVVAVSMDQERAAVKKYLRGLGRAARPRGWTVLLDTPDQSTLAAYYSAARAAAIPDEYELPQTYVVDRSGTLAGWLEGPRDWSGPAARAYLEGLLR